MKEEQMLLYYEPTDERMQRELSELRTQLNNVRKGLFARNTALAKLVMELRDDIEMLKGIKKKESKVIELESFYG